MTGNGTTKAQEVGGRGQKYEKLPQACLRFEWMASGDLEEGQGVLYGTLLGAPYYKKGRGLQFVIEGAYARDWDHWVWDDWKVTVTLKKGATRDEILALWNGIAQNRAEYLREGEDVAEKITVERAVIVGRQQQARPPEA